eukprot:gene13962-19901_t
MPLLLSTAFLDTVEYALDAHDANSLQPCASVLDEGVQFISRRGGFKPKHCRVSCVICCEADAATRGRMPPSMRATLEEVDIMTSMALCIVDMTSSSACILKSCTSLGDVNQSERFHPRSALVVEEQLNEAEYQAVGEEQMNEAEYQAVGEEQMNEAEYQAVRASPSERCHSPVNFLYRDMPHVQQQQGAAYSPYAQDAEILRVVHRSSGEGAMSSPSQGGGPVHAKRHAGQVMGYILRVRGGVGQLLS